MFQIIEYIKFLFRSTNQHGVHSPFVFDLVTKCFYDRVRYESYMKLESYRRTLLQNRSFITIEDLGSGSRVFRSNKRRIRSIAKTSGTTRKRAQLLYRIVKYFQPEKSLELGTSLGIATQALALGNRLGSLISMEGCPNLSQFTKQQLSEHNLDNIEIITGPISENIGSLKTEHFDLIFFDADHTKASTLNYFYELCETAGNDTVFIFDDIHWSKDMLEAWETIKSHPKVTVTIDTFFWGFVFFRREQVKEHFTIRL